MLARYELDCFLLDFLDLDTLVIARNLDDGAETRRRRGLGERRRGLGERRRGLGERRRVVILSHAVIKNQTDALICLSIR